LSFTGVKLGQPRLKVFENGMLKRILDLLRWQIAVAAENCIKGRFLIWYVSSLFIKVIKLNRCGLDM
jgi:hypothetical protein